MTPNEATKIVKGTQEIAVIGHQFSDGILPEIVILDTAIGDEENSIPMKAILTPFEIVALGWSFQ